MENTSVLVSGEELEREVIGGMRVVALVILLTMALFGAAVIGGIVWAVNAASASEVVAEDEPGWNCYTMGNQSCGDTLAYVEATDEHGRGAILPVANDGIVYVSWQDGTVTPAAYWQRMAAWRTCIDYADGSDASLQDCDTSFQNPGERFVY